MRLLTWSHNSLSQFENAEKAYLCLNLKVFAEGKLLVVIKLSSCENRLVL